MATVMTIGYQDRTIDDVVAMLRSADVKVLVDVRLTPLSRKAGLSKNGLAAWSIASTGYTTSGGTDVL